MHSELRMPDVLIRQLSRLRDRLVGVTVAGGIGLTMLVLSLQLGAILLLDLLVELPLSVRVLLLLSVPAVAVTLVALSVVQPFLQRYRKSDLAVVVEQAHPELKERLLSLVELQESAARGDEPSSEFMRSLLMQQTVEFAKKHDFAESVDATRAVRRCWLGVAALCALLLPLLFASNAYAVLISRFLNPWGNYERPQNLILTVDQPDRVIARGDDVPFIVRPSWRFREGVLPDAVWLDWTSHAGAVQSRRLDWNAEQKTYSLILPRVQESFDYHVSANQSQTRRHHVEVVDAPQVEQFAVDVIPPAYTGEAAIHHDNVLGEILAVEQSRLELHLKLNKPVARAEIVWLDAPVAPAGAPRKDNTVKPATTALELSADRQSAELQMFAALNGPSGRFVVRLSDEHELTSRMENIFRLTIRPDLPPAVQFTDQEQHTSARPQDLVRLPLQATDDFGVATLELHYDVLRNGTKEPGIIAVPADQFPAREVAPVIELDLAPLNLQSGMQVAFRARATDERTVPGPNESWTGTRLIQILDEARPYGEQTLAETQHRINQAMDKLKTEMEQQQQAARQLQAQAQTEDARHQEWSGDKKAAQLEENIQDLAQQVQKLSAVLEEQPIMQPLADRAREISERELTQAGARAEESRQVPLPQKQQKLAEAAEKLKKAEEDFKKLQEEHQEMAEKQRDLLELNRIAQNTEQLANQVDELTRRKPTPAADRNAPPTPQQEMWNLEHQKLVQRHEQLEDDLDQVLRDHPELIEKARENLSHQLATLGERAQQLARQQEMLMKPLEKKPQQESTREKAPPKDSQSTGTNLKESNAPKSGEKSPGQTEQQAVEQSPQSAPQAGEQESAPPNSSQKPSPQESGEMTSPQQAGQKSPNQPSDQNPQQLSSKLATLPDEQQELSRQAKELGEQIRKLELRNQEIDKASSQLPNMTRAAAQELADGNFKRAAELAQEAREKAEQLAESLKKPGEQPIPERLQAAAEEARQQQQALSQRIQELADSAKQQEDFRKQRQEELRALTQQMEKQLASRSDQLELKEIDRPEQAKLTRAAQEQLKQAADQMRQTPSQQQNSEQTQSDRAKPGQSPQQSPSGQMASEQSQPMQSEQQSAPQQSSSQKSEQMPPDQAQQSQQPKSDQTPADQMKSQQSPSQPMPSGQQTSSQSQQQSPAEKMPSEKPSPQQSPQMQSDQTKPEPAQSQQSQKPKQAPSNQSQPQQSQKSDQKQADKTEPEKSSPQKGDQKEDQSNSEAKTGQQAAESLKKAGSLAKQASQGTSPGNGSGNSAQGEAGQSVAESAQLLRQAGKQLSQLGQPQPGRQSDSKTPTQEKSAEQGEKESDKGSDSSVGEPKPGSQKQSTGNPESSSEQGDSSEASQSLRNAAKNLREAAQQMGLSSRSEKSNTPNQKPGGRNANESTGRIASDSAGNGEANLKDLEKSLGKVSRRNWGQLPKNLQTELIESGQRTRDATYGSLIRRYFEEISRTRPAQLEEGTTK